MTTRPPTQEPVGLVRLDPWLEPYEPQLRERLRRFREALKRMEAAGGLLGSVSLGHRYLGLNRGERDGAAGLWYREWAPGATYLALIGDFNGWDRGAHPMARDEWGVWSIFLPDGPHGCAIAHDGRLKVHVAHHESAADRLPAYATRVVQEPDTSFCARWWSPAEPYAWRHEAPAAPPGLRIYEAHVGMALEEGRVGSFGEFRRDVLPRIAAQGYNALQLMAVMEHPFYASFGYHVSSFFAVSSRFGTPDELKALVDEAHRLGLTVIMDLIHSHSVKNAAEGLNRFDGTDHQYFHAPPRGEHPAWDSLCFDYSKAEPVRFLLSNVRFWLEEYRFDGFRFDGVTSMLYLDHGLGRPFNRYDDYFGDNIDADAVTYLMLANELAHAVRPGAVTVAEDVSGMPGLARPTAEGGLGFDYRLAMGVPDMWIRLLKERKDEEWNLGEIVGTLLNRRHTEKHVGYAESHDQAMVGDKTLAFWLMDQRMYWNMDRATADPVVERGIALHKMIRLITFALAGDAYLNFMGNEFGHPEWIDFPRQGNGYSYHYARRQWSLAGNGFLRYQGLNEFDRAMMALDERRRLLSDPFIEQLSLDEEARVLVVRRGALVFAFNFDAERSYSGLRIPVPDAVDYTVALDTDRPEFGGFGRTEPGAAYLLQAAPAQGRDQSVQVYLPARSAQVLEPAAALK